MNILVTGGAGFIGSNFIHHLLKQHPGCQIINVDSLTYAGNLNNLAAWEDNPRYTFVKADITDADQMEKVFREHSIQFVVNFAAESHVDRSIMNPDQFVRTNVLGTQNLLDLARKANVDRFIQVSTDEVYGTLGKTGLFSESTPLAPNSPYSASKAGADLLVRSYYETYGFPAIVTRCSNNYGPYQFPEKLIPLMIVNALKEQPLPVYGDGLQVRDWLHVEDHCKAIDLIMHEGKPGGIYNIGGMNERTNLSVVQSVLNILGKPADLITYVEDRLGHDRRYAIDASKIRDELGWEPLISFEQGLEQTVEWYLDHTDWWENILTGDYLQYYKKQYRELNV